MGDSDIHWPIFSSGSSSASWMAGSMDWEYEYDETGREIIFSAQVHIDHEEIKSQASNEPDLTITNTKRMVVDSLDVGETEDTSALREGSQRGFTYGRLLWDASRKVDINLYDDLDDWCWEGNELPGEDSEESMDDSEDSSSTSGDASGKTLPYDG